MFSARILLDSQNDDGGRLTTFELELPKFLLAQLNTHRVFSRNAASSRAIPTKRIVAQVRDNPVMPLVWGRNQPGMQAGAEIDEVDQAKEAWLSARVDAIRHAERLAELGVHKQIVNRLLEPFMVVRVLLSGTTFDNFFRLRCDDMAQPEIAHVAIEMRRALHMSIPRKLECGEWHTPYVDALEVPDLDDRKMVSAARCARVSYLNYDGEKNIEKDLELAKKLINSCHWSPFEHVAVAISGTSWACKNFSHGFEQFRAELDES